MISQPLTIIRTNKLGKPYVQDTDPSISNNLSVNDIWLNPSKGTLKTWGGTDWQEMQFGESAFLDNCITNRLIANGINASKITTGILQSNDGSFYVNMETGEAELLKLIMGGEIEGNIIATSSNGLTRVRLRGREGENQVTAGIITEERESTDEGVDWSNAGQIFFDYNTRQTWCVFKNFQIGAYNSRRPSMGYNSGSADGLLYRPLSQDWLRAGYATYHGYKIASRDSTSDAFTTVTPVLTALGDCMSGTAVVGTGTVTCTYQMNDVMRIDFYIKITTSGSGSSSYGISRNLLRQLNAEIPVITPIDGGVLNIYNSSGSIITSNVATSFIADDVYWTPARLLGSSLSAFLESSMSSGFILTGTCYGTYSFED